VVANHVTTSSKTDRIFPLGHCSGNFYIAIKNEVKSNEEASGVRPTLFTIKHGPMAHFFIADKPFKNMLKP
jgi:hypothetical protein